MLKCKTGFKFNMRPLTAILISNCNIKSARLRKQHYFLFSINCFILLKFIYCFYKICNSLWRLALILTVFYRSTKLEARNIHQSKQKNLWRKFQNLSQKLFFTPVRIRMRIKNYAWNYLLKSDAIIVSKHSV